jgi:hypothetical protein
MILSQYHIFELDTINIYSVAAQLMYQYAPCRLHICNNWAITALQYNVILECRKIRLREGNAKCRHKQL